MPGKVVDASIMGAIAFQEGETTDAMRLVSGADLYAPLLLKYELTSIARTKATQTPADQPLIEMNLAAALATAVQVVDVDYARVLQLAIQNGLSTYDSSYLEVAITLGMPLATFHQKLATAAGRYGLRA